MKKHYRLCHHCEHLNSDRTEIEQCACCKRYFVRYFFCDDLNQFFRSDIENRLHIEPQKSKPIVGISFVWRDDSA